jgi:hypothetical protein
MVSEKELSIANLSQLTDEENFLLQVSKKSGKLSGFIKNDIPDSEKQWLADFKSWELSNNWLKIISDICISEYDQVFFDVGEELFDLKDSIGYEEFRKKILDANM